MPDLPQPPEFDPLLVKPNSTFLWPLELEKEKYPNVPLTIAALAYAEMPYPVQPIWYHPDEPVLIRDDLGLPPDLM